MKKLLFLITVMSLSFSQGTVYLGLEQTPEWDDGSGAMDMDAGGMVLGYNHPVHMSEDGKYVLSFGTSINMSDMMITGADNATNDRMGYLAWYALPMWNFSEKVSAWMSLGYARALQNSENTCTGLTYGLGAHYRVNDTYGVGLGYVTNTNEMTDGNSTWDREVSRLTVYVSKSLAGMFK